MAGMKLFEIFGIIDIDDSGAEEKVDKNEKSGRQLAETFKNVGGKVASAGKVIGGTLTAVSGVATAATAAISENSNAIDKGAQNIGFSTDAYQEWNFVLKQTGTDMEEASGGIAALTEKAVDAANGGEGNIEVFRKLGIEMEDLQGLTQQEIFEKTIEGLQNMTDETQRAALASELMGGSGEVMGALLNKTSEDVAKMREEAHGLGAVLSEDTIKAGVEMSETIENMKATLIGTLTEAFAPMIPTVMELIKTFVDILPPVLEFIKPLVEKMVPVVTKIIEKLLPPFIRLLDALMPVLNPLIDVFLVLLDSALIPLIEALLPLIEVILPPLATLLEALVPIIEGLTKLISVGFTAAIEGITATFRYWADELQPVFNILKKIGDLIGTVTGGLADIAGSAVEGVGNFFGNIKLPSFDTGIDFVPRDMTANIHAGEAVLTAEENRARMAGGSGGDTYVFRDNYLLSDQGMDDFMDRMTDRIRGRGVMA